MTILKVPTGEVVDFGDRSDDEIETILFQEFPELRNDIPFVPDPIERGAHMTGFGLRQLQHGIGLRNDEDFSRDVANYAKKMRELPLSPDAQEQYERIAESDSVGSFAKNLITSPDFILDQVGQSLGIGVTGIGAGVASAYAGLPSWAARLALGTGFGVGSGTAEAGGQFFDDLQELAGVDPNNPEQVQQALQDEALVKTLRKRSRDAGIPVAAFDGLTAGIAGLPWKLMTGGAPTLGRKAIGATAELGSQAAGGVAGAATSQLLVDGAITDPIELGLEGALEIITGGPQAVFSTLVSDPVTNPAESKIRNAFGKSYNENIAQEQKDELLGASRTPAPVEEDTQELDLTEAQQGELELGVVDDKKQKAVGRVQKLQAEIAELERSRSGLQDVKNQNIASGNTDFDGFVSEAQKKHFDSIPSRLATKEKKLANTLQRHKLKIENGEVKPSKPLAEKRKAKPKKKTKAAKDSGTYVDSGAKLIHINQELDELQGQYKVVEDSQSPEAVQIQKRMAKLYRDRGEVKAELEERKAEVEGRPVEEIRKETPDQEYIENLEREILDTSDKLQEATDERNKAEESGDKEAFAKAQERVFGLEQTITQQSIDLEIEKAKFQKAEALSTSPTRDFDVHFNKRLKATSISPQEKANLEKAAKKVKKILEKVGGPHIEPQIVQELVQLDRASSGIPQALRGAQFANMAIVALSNVNPTETAYHEAWHFLKRAKILNNPRINNIIQRDIPKYRDLIVANSGISPAEFETFLATPEGREELSATAFGIVASRWDKEGKVIRGLGLSRPSHNLFKQLYDAVKRMWDTFRGEVNSLEDLFVDASSGQLAVQELIQHDNLTRLQPVADAARQAHAEEFLNNKQIMEDIRRGRFLDYANPTRMHSVVRFMSTKFGLGNYYNIYADAVSTQMMSTQEAHALNVKYSEMSKPFFDLEDKNTRYAISEIAMHNSENSKRATYNDDGSLTYRDHKTGEDVTITNKSAVTAYKALQDTAHEVLKDYESLYRHKAEVAFGLSKGFTIKDIDNLIAEEENEARITQLENLKETLLEFRKMRGSDYIPKMRFGDQGVAIYERNPEAKDELGQQVFLGTVERYDRKTKYHPIQLEKLKKRIKDGGYLDTEKYVIRGSNKSGEAATIKNLDDLELFELTRDTESNLVKKSLVTVDMLASLLGSKNIDEKDLRKTRAELSLSLDKKGFDKKFVEAKSIDGYSTDWDRVWKAFIGGAAKSRTYMKYQDIFSKIAQEAKNSTDPNISQGIKDYFEYVENGQEDQQGLRAFNFFWAMGFNVSTAMLQYMTLPSMTWGTMNQFSGNAIHNMGLITKWGKYGMLFLKNGAINWVENSPLMRVDDAKTWADIEKRNEHLSQEQFNRLKAHAIDLYKRGVLGAVMVEENVGPSFSGDLTAKEKGLSAAQKAVQASGFMVAIAEQNTRFATALAIAEQLVTDPKAEAKADAMYQDENMYNSFKNLRPDLGAAEHASIYSLHRAHAVFGKDARPDMFKGLGGSVFMPFMTWPVFMWGLMNDMFKNRGVSGHVGLFTSLSMMALMGGVAGLPAWGILKELVEELWKGLTGDEKDLVNEIYDGLGGGLVAETVAHGLFQSLGEISVSSRISIPVPGEQILLTLLGINKDASAQFGMTGSVLKNLRESVENYYNGNGVGAIVPELLPTQFSNLAKAVEYGKKGVTTQQGRTTLIAPEEVDVWDTVTRMFGVTSANVALAREREWATKVLNQEHKTGYNRIKNQLINTQVKMVRAERRGDDKEAKKQAVRLEKLQKKFYDWAERKKYYVPVASISRAIMQETQTRLNGNLDWNRISKAQRPEVFETREMYDKMMGRK